MSGAPLMNALSMKTSTLIWAVGTGWESTLTVALFWPAASLAALMV